LNEDVQIFLEPILPSPTLVIVGGVHIAIALASLSKILGYRTIMIDPRRFWGNEERFPHVDQLIAEWPQEAFSKVHVTRSTAIVMLTHDPKLDDPAVKTALSGPAFYVGALGSKKTALKRHERLLNDGLSESELSRLHAPIGLDIGAQTPQEIALAIMAEVVDAHRRQDQSQVRVEANLHSMKQ
jgi:xanthine dehydrogenase accessory factor